MSVQKNLKIALASAALLTLVSCGSDKSSKSNPPMVDQIVTSADWKVLMNGRSFPDKAMIEIDGELVLNECASKQRFEINRASEPQSFTMEGHIAPRAATVNVKITDLGINCDSESSFHNGNEDYEMSKNGSHAEVLINI